MSVTLSKNMLLWLESNNDLLIENQLWAKLTEEEKNILKSVRKSILAQQQANVILKQSHDKLAAQYSESQKSQAFFLEALDVLSTPIFIKNVHAQFIFINKAYEAIFNITRKELIGKSVLESEYLDPVERKIYQTEDESLLERQNAIHRPIRLEFATGPKNCWYWSSGFKESSFGQRGLIGTFVNITDLIKKTDSLALRVNELAEANKNIEKLANHDPLTGLYNRLSMNNHLMDLIVNNQRYDEPFSALMLDIDHFKLVNDEYGHLEGDYILQEVGNFIAKYMRKADIGIRYGGEEFLILLPTTTIEHAFTFAQRLCTLFPERIIKSDGLPVTASIGVTEYIPCENIESLMHRVDTYLYLAKKTGRARVSAGE